MDLRQGDRLPSVRSIPGVDQSGRLVGLDTPFGVAVVTQCCDLARGAAVVHVSPIVELDSNRAAGARSGKTSRFGVLRDTTEHFVDFSVVATLPMGHALANIEGRVEQDATQRSQFAAAFARRFSRFGFPESFVPCLKPLQDYVRSKAGKPGSPIYPVLERIVTIRVEAEPDWNSQSSMSVNFVIVVPSDYLPSVVDPFTDDPRDLNAVCKELEDLLAKESHDPKIPRLWDEFAMSLTDLVRSEADRLLPELEICSEVSASNEFTLDRYLASYALDLDDISEG